MLVLHKSIVELLYALVRFEVLPTTLERNSVSVLVCCTTRGKPYNQIPNLDHRSPGGVTALGGGGGGGWGGGEEE